jgi:hypothetical protein
MWMCACSCKCPLLRVEKPVDDDTGPDVVKRKAARSLGRTPAERNAIDSHALSIAKDNLAAVRTLWIYSTIVFA